MTEVEKPPREPSFFRSAIGLLAMCGGLGGLAALFFIEVPAGNRDALMLGLGAILGWGASVVNYEFGGSTAGRKAAEAGIKQNLRL